MPRPPDRVQLQKQEDPNRGGDGADSDPFVLNAPLDPTEDAPEVGGFFIQESGVRDEQVVTYRENGQMYFEDASHSGENRVNLHTLRNASGVILTSNNGTEFRITVDDDGVLITTAL